MCIRVLHVKLMLCCHDGVLFCTKATDCVEPPWLLNGQLHLEHRMKRRRRRRKTTTEQWYNVLQSETRSLPCAFITHREDLLATRSTETLLLVGKKMRGVAEEAEGEQKDAEKDWKKENLLRCVIAPLSLKQLSFQMNPITGASPLPLANRQTPRFQIKQAKAGDSSLPSC